MVVVVVVAAGAAWLHRPAAGPCGVRCRRSALWGPASPSAQQQKPRPTRAPLGPAPPACRDLKLENILLTGGPLGEAAAKLADFGLHKRVRRGPGGLQPFSAALDASVWNGQNDSYYGANLYASVHGGRTAQALAAALAGGGEGAGAAGEANSSHAAVLSALQGACSARGAAGGCLPAASSPAQRSPSQGTAGASGHRA